MPETTVEGFAAEVRFVPADDWSVWVAVVDADDQLPPGATTDGFPINAGKLSVDGREVDRRGLLAWLAGGSDRKRLPRVVITGNFGPDSYEVCHSAEFFSPSPDSPPARAKPTP